MGQRASTYGKWESRYDALLEIYRADMPSIETQDVVEEVIEFAKSRGLSVDREVFHRRADLNTHQDHGCRGC